MSSTAERNKTIVDVDVRDGRIEQVKEFLDTGHTRAVFVAP